MTPQSPEDEGNAFQLDDDEDMLALMEAAAKIGSAATEDEADGSLDVFNSVEPAEVIAEQKSVIPENSPVEQMVASQDPDFDSLFTEPSAVEPAVEVPEIDSVIPTPEPQEIPATPEPVNPVPEPARNDSRIVVPPASEEDQIKHARAIISAADIYRNLDQQTKSVVAQLIAQDPDVELDEAVIAIKAIHTDELTFATMESLKKAKELSAVDRAFYILGLETTVRENLGGLTIAFIPDLKFPDDSGSLDYAKILVKAIDGLSADVIAFVSATESVLRAAKQR